MGQHYCHRKVDSGPPAVRHDRDQAAARWDGTAWRGRLCSKTSSGVVDGLDRSQPFERGSRKRVVDALLLDCELVCFGATGHPDFARLRGRLVRSGSQAGRATQTAPATLIVFDVLHLDGRAVRRLPYSQRRRLLAELALDGEHWRTPRAYRAGRDDLAGVTREHGLEGVVAKRLSARTWRVAVPRARGASSNTVTSKRSSSPPGSGASDEATSCSSRGAIPTRASYATPAAFPCA
jgi:hypothetical protein